MCNWSRISRLLARHLRGDRPDHHPPRRARQPTVLFISLLFLLAFLGPGLGRIIDPQLPADTLLDSLEAELDAKGIDIRRGTGGDTKSVYTPQLARLKNFPDQFGLLRPLPLVLNLADRPAQGTFEAAFQEGAFSDTALFAANNARNSLPNTATDDANKFRQDWSKSPKEGRIFVSFSGRDLHHAQAVARALQAQGHSTFLYRTETGELFTNAVEVGTFFKEAGQHLVIDTLNARNSEAVRAEARALHVLLGDRIVLRGTDPPAHVTHRLPEPPKWKGFSEPGYPGGIYRPRRPDPWRPIRRR